MIASCESCGEDFLTESDPYVVRPTNNGNKLYCYCHIKGFDEVITKADKLQAENAKLKKALQFTILAAEQQYQPNRPLEKGLCPTFYFTLSYEGDLELIEETKRARQVLTDLEEK